MAIRIALGAQRADIVWLVVAQALALVGTGLTMGIGAARSPDGGSSHSSSANPRAIRWYSPASSRRNSRRRAGER